MKKISVPATTANLGPGFDCLGMALDFRNEIYFEEIEKGFSVEIAGRYREDIPKDENNLLYRAYKSVFDSRKLQVPGLKIRMVNNIPLARGLGSSASVIVAGIKIADRFLDSALSEEEILFLATEMEGHPDNVAPALLGGMVISGKDEDGRIKYARCPVPPVLKTTVMVPEYCLSTRKARAVLPERVPFNDAVANVGRTAFLVSCFYRGDFSDIGFGLGDYLHQPYRSALIKGFSEIKQLVKGKTEVGCAVSGAGPSIIFFHTENIDTIVNAADDIILEQTESVEILRLLPDNRGAFVE